MIPIHQVQNLWGTARVIVTSNVALTGAPSTVDGVELAAGDRVLLIAQSTGSENGVYIYDGANLARPTQDDNLKTGAEATLGASVTISEGTYVGKVWYLSACNGGQDGRENVRAIIGTSNMTITEHGAGGGGGGSIISNPGVAYVRSDGDDDTAEIGNPALPFETGTAAWAAGARNYKIGVGTFSATILDEPTDPVVNITGEGAGCSIFNLIFTASDGVTGSEGTTSDPPGVGGTGTAGADIPALTVYSDHSVTIGISMISGDGGGGGTGGTAAGVDQNGATGGNGNNSGSQRGACYLNNVSGSFEAVLGIAGPGGSGGTPSGAGVTGDPGTSGSVGTGQPVNAYFCRMYPLTASNNTTNRHAVIENDTFYAS